MLKFDRQARIAFIAACVTLAICGIGFRAAMAYLQIYLQKERVDLREHFATIPRTLGNWQAVGPDGVLDATIVETLGTDIYLDRDYALNGDVSQGLIKLHIAYYTGMIDAIPHIPDRCMLAGGFVPTGRPRVMENMPLDISNWRYDPEVVNRASGQPYPYVTYPHAVTGRTVMVRMPLGAFGLRMTPFEHPSMPQQRIYAGFFFIANGHVTPNPLAVRALALDLTDRYAYYCKVQFTAWGGSDFDEQAFADLVGSLTQELLPELMRCLPDWPEVESRLPPGRSASARTNQ
ncbi:MAG TPA: exosortase-associated EpsI family protein [Phycisphaerales bacterium]|nr:exosortase-associated EpsI family protein [Phycisphaerales bacterium]